MKLNKKYVDKPNTTAEKEYNTDLAPAIKSVTPARMYKTPIYG
jgi:hypothetical protein